MDPNPREIRLGLQRRRTAWLITLFKVTPPLEWNSHYDPLGHQLKDSVEAAYLRSTLIEKRKYLCKIGLIAGMEHAYEKSYR